MEVHFKDRLNVSIFLVFKFIFFLLGEKKDNHIFLMELCQGNLHELDAREDPSAI